MRRRGPTSAFRQRRFIFVASPGTMWRCPFVVLCCVLVIVQHVGVALLMPLAVTASRGGKPFYSYWVGQTHAARKENNL